jgi:two-component system, cell cycle sensor histidine kinase and response regulator CckA
MLIMLGCRAATATNGTDAIDIYRDASGEFDIVLIDLIMPGMDGKETYRRLHAINPEIIAVTISGYSVDGEIEELRKEGVKAFLQKPFGYTELADTLTRVLHS